MKKIKTHLGMISLAAIVVLFLCSAAAAQEETATSTHPLWDVESYVEEGADQGSPDYPAFFAYMTKHSRAWPDHMRFYLVDPSLLVPEAEGEDYDPSHMRLDVDGASCAPPQYCESAYPVMEYRSGGMRRANESYYLEKDKKALLVVSSLDGSLRYLVQNVESQDGREERFAVTFYDKGIGMRTIKDEWEMRCAIDILALENFVPVEYGQVFKITNWWNKFPHFLVWAGNKNGEKYSGPVTVLY